MLSSAVATSFSCLILLESASLPRTIAVFSSKIAFFLSSVAVKNSLSRAAIFCLFSNTSLSSFRSRQVLLPSHLFLAFLLLVVLDGAAFPLLVVLFVVSSHPSFNLSNHPLYASCFFKPGYGFV